MLEDIIIRKIIENSYGHFFGCISIDENWIVDTNEFYKYRY